MFFQFYLLSIPVSGNFDNIESYVRWLSSVFFFTHTKERISTRYCDWAKQRFGNLRVAAVWTLNFIFRNSSIQKLLEYDWLYIHVYTFWYISFVHNVKTKWEYKYFTHTCLGLTMTNISDYLLQLTISNRSTQNLLIFISTTKKLFTIFMALPKRAYCLAPTHHNKGAGPNLIRKCWLWHHIKITTREYKEK